MSRSQPMLLNVVLACLVAAAHGLFAQEKKTGPIRIPRAEYSTETQVFGVRGKGNRFVYVFDRSSSMGDFEGRPLAAAKRELLASLSTLRPLNQFQIVFFNERPRLLGATREQIPQMLFADEDGRRQAEPFIESITADGGTDRLGALRMALRIQPDVIFFLSDADKPLLTSADLQSVQRLNRGTIIHAIEFGVGPQLAGENFLHGLARTNGGEHAYVDVTRLAK